MRIAAPLQAIGPRLGGEALEHEAVVLGEHAAAVADGARDQLGRVAAAGADLAHALAGRDLQEREQLVGMAAGVQRAIRFQASRILDDLANERRDARMGDADHGLRLARRAGVLRAQPDASEKTTSSAAGASLQVVIRVQVCA